MALLPAAKRGLVKVLLVRRRPAKQVLAKLVLAKLVLAKLVPVRRVRPVCRAGVCANEGRWVLP